MIPKTNTIASFNADEKGVSPVIGVILMVAITVILAAVIGSFVLGIGSDISETPQASFDFNPNSDTIVHQGGDSFDSGNLEVKNDSGSVTVNTDISAGGDLLQNYPNYSLGSDQTVRVIWNDPSSDSSNEIASFNT